MSVNRFYTGLNDFRYIETAVNTVKTTIWIFIFITVILVWCLLSNKKYVRPDEYIHLHNIWMVSQEKLPYRDYFDHHAPWYHFLMAPACLLFEPELSSDSARMFIRFSRNLSLIVTLCGLCILTAIGWLWKDKWFALATIVLLTGYRSFLETAMEIRPDVPAFLLWMGTLFLIRNGLGSCCYKDNEDANNALVQVDVLVTCKWYACSFLWAGLLLGAAVMFTQKMLFVLPGLGIVLCCWAWQTSNKHSRFWCLVRFSAGCLVPTLVTLMIFAWNGAGYLFVDRVFLMNARWVELPDQNAMMFLWIFSQSWHLFLLGILGMILLLISMGMHDSMDWFATLLVATVIGWLIGLAWIIPVTDRQFYMISQPIIAFLGAHGVQEFIRRILDCTDRFCHNIRQGLRISFGNAVMRLMRSSYGMFRIFAFLICVLFLVWNQIAGSMRSVSWDTFDSEKLAMWMVDNTSPSDVVLDTLSNGAGTFRMQGWYYGYIHGEIPSIIEPEAIHELMDDLRSGSLCPEIITYDPKLSNLHPDLYEWIKDNYQQISDAPSLMRRLH